MENLAKKSDYSISQDIFPRDYRGASIPFPRDDFDNEILFFSKYFLEVKE